MTNEVIEFSLQNQHHPPRSPQTLSRFLNELTSSAEMVFDYHLYDHRVLTAILVDRIQNPCNSANLEIIGFKTGLSDGSLFHQLMVDVKKALPSERSGIEIALNQKSRFNEDMLRDHGFFVHYTTYDMKRSFKDPLVALPLPAGYSWGRLNSQIFSEYYDVLRLSFAKNLEISIPPISEMRTGFQTNKYPPSILYKDNKVIGFASISADDSDSKIGEVHMIGLHPSWRQKGLGSLLLMKAIVELEAIGANDIKLTVAAANKDALQLYRKFGFEIVDSDIFYRYPKSSEAVF